MRRRRDGVVTSEGEGRDEAGGEDRERTHDERGTLQGLEWRKTYDLVDVGASRKFSGRGRRRASVVFFVRYASLLSLVLLACQKPSSAPPAPPPPLVVVTPIEASAPVVATARADAAPPAATVLDPWQDLEIDEYDADRIVGLSAVSALCAALFHRARTGQGQRIDVPMFETMTAFVLGDHMAGRTFDPPLDGGGYARLLASERRPFRTRDGYLCALLYNDAQWRSFYAAIGQAGRFEADPRLSTMAARSVHIADLYADLAAIFAGRSRAEWAALLEDADLCFAPVLSMTEAPRHPHNRAREAFVELAGVLQPAPVPRFSRTPGQVQTPPADEDVFAAWGVQRT